MKLFLNNLQPYRNTHPFVVAVSGGVDSMTLLFLLHQYQIPCIVVHFNHHTRKANQKERDLVIATSERYQYPYYIFDIHVTSGNFQHEARQLRLKHLKSIAEKHQTPYILTAHHLDDLSESILIKMTTGTDALMSYGFQMESHYDNFVFLKPLYNIKKQTIIDYANQNQLSFLEDASNFDHHYLRNRYRNMIIPIIKQENPKFLEHMLSYHEDILHLKDFIQSSAVSYLKPKNEIDIASFMHLPLSLQYEIIYILFKKLSNHILSKKDLNYIILLLTIDKPNNQYLLNDGIAFIRDYQRGYFIKTRNKISTPIVLNADIPVEINQQLLSFTFNKATISQQINQLCYNNVVLPLFVRNRLPNDTLSFHYGHKKLSRFLIDKKISTYQRDHLLVVTDGAGVILWIPNLYLNQTLGDQHQLYFQLREKENVKF